MKSDIRLINNIKAIINILYKNTDIKDSDLFNFDNDEINTPIGNALTLFNNRKSKLSDKIIDLKLLEKLAIKLNEQKAIVRLNHIGFCYKVKSSKKEKERIVKLIKETDLHLYEEPSNDEGLWFFVGDVKKWEDLTIEIIPIQETRDQDVDYWLPHIQIDIDMDLNEGEIRTLVESVFGEEINPFPIVIEGTTYIVRNRLGVVDGVNIFLDLATNSRNVKLLKEKIWTEVA